MKSNFNREVICVTIVCSNTSHNIVVHVLDEGHVFLWDFMFVQRPPHNISWYLVISLLQVNETKWRSFFCSLNRSITCLIKKIASVVDLLGMKPNWFVDICVVPRRRCSMTLSHNFIVWLINLILR